MKKYLIPKLIGLALLTMVSLVIVSILEVVVYSYLINPGRQAAVYDEHANITAPYISCIFGFIAFFLVARYWKKKKVENLSKLVFLFPLTYVLLDAVIITSFGVDWSEFILVFLIANGAKFLGSYSGYKLTK